MIGALPPPEPGLVLELLSGGDDGYTELAPPPSFTTCTRDAYAQGTVFAPAAAVRTIAGVAAACAHIHSHRITHGDLYAHNTMVSKRSGEPKLGDFGAAYSYEALGVDALVERVEVRATCYLLPVTSCNRTRTRRSASTRWSSGSRCLLPAACYLLYVTACNRLHDALVERVEVRAFDCLVEELAERLDRYMTVT